MGWREPREIYRGLVLLACFRDCRDERVVALNCARNSLLDVGFAVCQMFIEVRTIFGKNFVAKVASVLIL